MDNMHGNDRQPMDSMVPPVGESNSWNSARETSGELMGVALLQRPTLVLNRNWQPVGVATVARALTKVWRETARIVDPVDYQQHTWDDWARIRPASDEPFLRTMLCNVRVPEVVTLTRYDRIPSNSVTFSRRNVFKRDHFTCQYCGRQPGQRDLTIDHVIPRAQGGTSTWENCVLACMECNSGKANRTPQQAGMLLQKLPARPRWKPVYANRGFRVDSWSRFLSEAYWTVELEE